MKNNKAVKFLLFESYLSFIKKSVGCKSYQTVWVKVNGKNKDITNKGELSCAFYITSILKIFSLITSPHTTVQSALKDLKQFGWYKINQPKPGAILHWEAKTFKKDSHEHLGFYIKKNIAISHSYESRTPQQHNWTFGKINNKSYRKVIGIYWHKQLN